MTFNLASETEARIRSVAETRGQDPEDALIALLNRALADAEAEDELVAELRASVEDHAAGRSMTLEELRARLHVHRQEHDPSHDPSAAETAADEMAA